MSATKKKRRIPNEQKEFQPMSVKEVRRWLRIAERDRAAQHYIVAGVVAHLAQTCLWLNSGQTSPRVRALASTVMRDPRVMEWLTKKDAKAMAGSLVNQSPNKLPSGKRSGASLTSRKRK